MLVVENTAARAARMAREVAIAAPVSEGGSVSRTLRSRDRANLPTSTAPLERRSHDQKSRKLLFTRAARDVLVQVKEGAGDARCRGRRRRTGPWQAQQRTKRLHICRARRNERRTFADRQSLQRIDRCGDCRVNRSFQTKYNCRSWPLSRGKTGHRARSCLQFNSAKRTPCEWTCVAFSTDQSHPTRQKCRYHRHHDLCPGAGRAPAE